MLNRTVRTPSQTPNKLLMITTLLLFLITAAYSQNREYHVSIQGNDINNGAIKSPLRTIQAAADMAMPGDTITVHAGVYRERIDPPRGGISESQRITYQAAPNEKVEIKGSEIENNWSKVQDDLWKTTLPNSFFGDFNPFATLIAGDWFNPKGRKHHTGAVYLNGEWLTEASALNEVKKPIGKTPLWYAEVDDKNTTVWAQFEINPNEELVEVNARQTVFYPEETGRNYITVRGFIMRHAATPWAPPSAEQIGLIGTNWSRSWIIENNEISHSICTGVTLGKHGDEFDNQTANSATGYVKTIERAIARNWTKENIGHHIVRNNTISNCEQAGIVGSMGAVFSEVTNNHIYDIYTRRLFTGAEMGGIKFHAAIDSLIKNNRIHNTERGIWLDWMTQGTRVTGNVCYDNTNNDLFLEVNHGPCLVDNNIFLSGTEIRNFSQGSAFAHNLFTGRLTHEGSGRLTPYHTAHSTQIAGYSTTTCGDDRFYNNIFIANGEPNTPKNKSFGLASYNQSKFPIQANGNVYLNGAWPWDKEKNYTERPDLKPQIKLVQEEGGLYLHLTLNGDWKPSKNQLVTTDLLGKAKISSLPYENPNGSPITVDKDYFGTPRNTQSPSAGPFEKTEPGKNIRKIW